MEAKHIPESRGHHIVPACWLAGFTDTGEKHGTLWVTDLKRGKQWISNPTKSGRRRDFNRLSDEQNDPLLVEANLAKIEDIIAPVLKRLNDERRCPFKDELHGLLQFMAIQWARVPAFRPKILAIAEGVHRDILTELLKTPESWAEWLEENDLKNGPPDEYENWRELLRSGFSLSVNNDWLLKKAFQSANTTAQCLQAKHWSCSISKTGRFIGSDNPVMLDGTAPQIGFKNADILTYPVSRHVLLYGTRVVAHAPFLNLKYIARQNTFSMLCAEEQVFSHVPDFYWLDENERCQTDWSLFRKDKILASVK
jgi:hypothetical protein